MWALEYWPLLIWGAGIVIAFFVGGWRLALVVLTLGVGSNAYFAGRKAERDNLQKRVQQIEENRKNAYDEIDQRGTDKSDVVERLRDGSY